MEKYKKDDLITTFEAYFGINKLSNKEIIELLDELKNRYKPP